MGQTTRDNTRHIFRSLLALGVIESGANPATRGELILSLNDVNINSYAQAGRLLELSKAWLRKDEIKYYTEDVLGREKALSVDFNDIPENVYLDFIDTLLSLYKIGEREVDESIKIIYQKEGIKPLNLISHLILSIEANDKIHVYLESGDNLIIKPLALKRENTVWVVEGVREGDASTLKTTIPLHLIQNIDF